jgi:hypothetical protein
MSTLTLVLVILALVCFVVAAFALIKNVAVNFTALGLAFLTVAYLLNGVSIGTK